MNDIQEARDKLKQIVYYIQFEKLVTGIALVLIASTLFIYVVFCKKKKSQYLIWIPTFTILWGVTSIVAYFLNQVNAIYEDSSIAEKVTLQLRQFSINIMHWIFVMKYFELSLMLPKIFHEIMIDDFIEGGKFYQIDK